MKKRQFGGARVDSKWEKKLAETVFQTAIFKPDKFNYSMEHVYTPDFLVVGERVVKKVLCEENIFIEAKGRFRDHAEYSKYIPIKKEIESHAGYRFVFLFYNPSLPMPFAKKRKDGTKQTHGEWATKNGFEWYTEETFPKEWL